MFDSQAIYIIQSVQNGFLLRRFQIFQQIDNIVAFQIAHRVGQNLGFQKIDHVFANGLIQLRQDFTIKFTLIKADQSRPIMTIDLFEQIRDIRRVQRLHLRNQLITIFTIYSV